jgi:molybdenum cofactor cytidylyltransferase
MPEAGLVLLAAGEASRMGRPKQLLPVDGVPMLRRAATFALASRCRPVVVVCGARSDEVAACVDGLPVRVIENTRWEEGIGTSIQAGLAELDASKADAAVVALADQPLVGPEAYAKLVRAWERGAGLAVASVYAGTIGVPALFDRSLFPRLFALAPGEGCKKLLLELDPRLVARVVCREAAVDVDTPQDYARFAEGVPA